MFEQAVNRHIQGTYAPAIPANSERESFVFAKRLRMPNRPDRRTIALRLVCEELCRDSVKNRIWTFRLACQLSALPLA